VMTSTKNNGLASPQSQPAKSLSKRPAIFSPMASERNEFASIANKFAARGHDLSRIEYEHGDTYYVSKQGQTRVLSNWHDVKSVLVQIGCVA
jgi:hypothetical protein